MLWYHCEMSDAEMPRQAASALMSMLWLQKTVSSVTPNKPEEPPGCLSFLRPTEEVYEGSDEALPGNMKKGGKSKMNFTYFKIFLIQFIIEQY